MVYSGSSVIDKQSPPRGPIFRRFAACRELSKAKCRRVLRLGREFMGIWFAKRMASKQKESMNALKNQ